MDRRLLWLALGTFAVGVEGFVIATLLPAIAADSGVTITQAGYLVFAYAIAYAVGAPILSALTGKIDRRPLLAVVALIFAAGALLAAVSQGYLMLLLARLLIAVSAGLYAATAQAAAVTLSPPERRARAVSTVVMGTTMAVALGAPLGAFLSGFAGWRGTYLAIAGVGLLTALAIYTMLPRGIEGDRRGLRERLGVLTVPGLLPALVIILLYMAGPFAAFIYLGPVTTRLMGLDAGLLPFVMLAYGLGAALGNPLGGQLADRIGAQATVTLAAALNVAFLLMLGVVALVPHSVIVPVYFTFMLLWGIAGWMFVPGQVSRIVALSPSSAPLALSLNASFLYLGISAGALIGGYVLEHLPIGEIGLVAAIFPALALGLIYLTRPRPVLMPRMG
jgi:DHA1 family inner membrane transport protein